MAIVPVKQRRGGDRGHAPGMAADAVPGNPTTAAPAPRGPSWPRHIGTLLPGITRPAFRARSPAAAQLMADWPALVGPALAAITTPRRFAAGTLTLGCAGPVALELQHLATELAERINAALGQVLVQRLRFVQDAVAPRAGLPPRRQPPAPVPVPGVPPGALRDALAALGAQVAAGGDTDRA